LAALRVVAIVLTHRARPGIARPNGRPPNAWRMLPGRSELAEWAAFFEPRAGGCDPRGRDLDRQRA
jgi:hypothetical protein